MSYLSQFNYFTSMAYSVSLSFSEASFCNRDSVDD